MAQLDPSIILQAGKGVVPLKDPTEIADEQAIRQMRQMQLQQAQQGMQDDQAYRDVLRSGASGADLVTGLQQRGLGKQAMDAQKFQDDRQKSSYERGKAVTDAMKVGAEAVMQNPTEQFALQTLDDISRRYGIPAQHFDAGKAAIMQARNDPNKIRQLMGGLGAKADEALGKIENVNLGGVNSIQRVNPYSGETQVLGTQARTQSPDSIASTQQSNINSLRTDARAREANAGAAAGRVPSGYRAKEDGTLEFIPGGPADPSSKAGGGKPLTEGQSKALLFGTRMQEANEVLDALASDGKVFSTPGSTAGYGIGAAVNALNSSGGQQLDQAKRNFLNAVLRRESGAVIADSEFANADKQYFPQIGDSKDVIAQKKRNREVAMRGILAEVPDADTRISQVRGTGAPKAEAAAPKGPQPKQKSMNIGGRDVMAELAPDGKYYVQQNGKWFEVR